LAQQHEIQKYFYSALVSSLATPLLLMPRKEDGDLYECTMNTQMQLYTVVCTLTRLVR
jgi:hypothetical protein